MKSDGELDLGILPKKTDDLPKVCGPDSETPRYPDLTFRGEHAALFRKKYGDCASGDEYEMTVRVRVKVEGTSDSKSDDYNNRIEFAVVAIIGDVVEEDAGEEKDEPVGDSKPARRVGKKEKPENKALAASY